MSANKANPVLADTSTSAKLNYTKMSGYSVLSPALGQRRDIECCLTPPSNPDDISICKLSSPLVFDGRFVEREMETKMIGSGVNCYSIGWGPTYQTLNFTTISNKKCNEKLNT